MKKFLLFGGLCLFCTSAIFAEDGRWLAQKQSMSVWTGRWMLSEDNSLKYDENGNILTQMTTEYEYGRVVGYTRTSNTYNENNMVIVRMIEGSTNGMLFYPTDRRDVAYDPILTDVIISNEQTLWSDGKEVMGNSYHFDITRNDDGNITLAERAVYYNDIYDPTERFIVEYGDDGKAVSASQSQLGYNGSDFYWTETQKLYEISWVETDGQIYNINSMMGGKNKMKSAMMYDSNDRITLHMEFEYEDDGSYSITYTDIEEPLLIAKVIVTPLPNGGSTTMTTEEYDGEVYLTIEETVEYAPNGMILREYYCEQETGEEPIIEQAMGEFAGDKDRPVSYEYSVYDSEENDWIPSLRVEFSDYAFFPYPDSGVEQVDAMEDATTEYFNLQGIRIINPEKGTTCIEKRGNNTRKIIVR